MAVWPSRGDRPASPARPDRPALAVAGGLLAAADALARQRRFGGRYPIPTEQSFDGGFNFCRAAFRTGRFGRGGGWGVDYPDADVNLSHPAVGADPHPRELRRRKTPNHFVLQLTDDELFRCPFVMMTEPGAAVARRRRGAPTCATTC